MVFLLLLLYMPFIRLKISICWVIYSKHLASVHLFHSSDGGPAAYAKLSIVSGTRTGPFYFLDANEVEGMGTVLISFLCL